MKLWNLAYSVTNKCNLRCAHCYASSGIPYEDELSLEEICEKILDEAQLIGTKFITLTGGEPFTRKDILEIISEIKKRNIKVCVATNGMLLSKEMIKELKELQVDRIQLSLEGPDEESNDKIRGKGVYKTLTTEVVPALRKAGLFTAISITPTSQNYQKMEDMAALCHSLGVNTLSVRRYAFEGRAKENDIQSAVEENRWLLEEIKRLRQKYAGSLNIITGDPLFVLTNEKLEEYADKKMLGGCTAGVTSLAVDAHGTMKPCTRGKIELGNVRKKRLSDVWIQNEVLTKLRNRDLSEGSCGKCKYKMLCGGCRVAALGSYGNIFAGDPKCWLC